MVGGESGLEGVLYLPPQGLGLSLFSLPAAEVFLFSNAKTASQKFWRQTYSLIALTGATGPCEKTWWGVDLRFFF